MALFNHSRKFEFPGSRDRVAVVGATGEGKSTAALWCFSESADFDKKPWVLIDYKGEVIIDEMLANHDAQKIALEKQPPEKPGIYVVKPEPNQHYEMAEFLWRVYKRGKTGLFFDELSMVPEFKGAAGSGGPLKAILTQGRSKEIPVYGLVQRPVEVNLHTFTEAQFIWQFYLKRKADKERVQDYLPEEEKLFKDDKPLPRHWSKWWDDKRRVALILRPTPDKEIILDTISERVDKMRSKRRI